MSPLLRERVAQALGPDGALAQGLPGPFQDRPGQRQLADAVAQTLDEGGVLVAEAGTGIGKTYAYLVPALLSGRRVLISTATKTLQDQLYGRDLPALLAALRLASQLALLKGRGSYLCLERLGRARWAGRHLPLAELAVLGQVERWAQHTRSGDLGELPQLDERSPLLPLVTSTRENCLGAACPQAGACHVNQARRRAQLADVTVINHHLFFSDLALQELAPVALLPEVPVIVFDEAHRLNDIALPFLGRQLGTAAVAAWARDLVDAGLRCARGWQPWPELGHRLDRAARDWARALARDLPAGARQRWTAESLADTAAVVWTDLEQALQQAQEALARVGEAAPELQRLQGRGQALQQTLAALRQPPGMGQVRWLERGAQPEQLRWLEAPTSMGPALQAAWSARQGRQAAWVFTSATLGSGANLDWFLAQSGLAAEARTLVVPSPFDYGRQAAWHVPEAVPLPGEPNHTDWLGHWLAEPVRQLGGRSLVLMTTQRAMQRMAEVLRQRLRGSGVAVLCQGEGGRAALLAQFRQGRHADGRPGGCVLVATGAFWEGVDVPGEALQLLVIDKLPFAPPDDPLEQAWAEQLRARSLSPFEHQTLPQAITALRQGVGRLIRSTSDRGLLVLGDARILRRQYGARLMAALPPMRLLSGDAAFQAALVELTRASTTDRSTCP